jgi:hypothetical protein
MLRICAGALAGRAMHASDTARSESAVRLFILIFGNMRGLIFIIVAFFIDGS